MPQKVWAVGEEVLAADFNTYVQQQVVAQFPNTAARDAWASPPAGAMCITTDTYTTWIRAGGAWQSYREILYSQLTSTQTITSTTAAGATGVINPGNFTYDGTPVIIEFYSTAVTAPAVAGGSLYITLWDTSTDLGFFGQVQNPAAAAPAVPVLLRRRITPTAGVHNYNIKAFVSSGSAVITASTGTTASNPQPAYLRVSRAL